MYVYMYIYMVEFESCDPPKGQAREQGHHTTPYYTII